MQCAVLCDTFIPENILIIAEYSHIFYGFLKIIVYICMVMGICSVLILHSN